MEGAMIVLLIVIFILAHLRRGAGRISRKLKTYRFSALRPFLSI